MKHHCPSPLTLLAACITCATFHLNAAQQLIHNCDSATGWSTVAPATVASVPGASNNALQISFPATNAPNPGGGPSPGGIRLRNSNDNAFYPSGGSTSYGGLRFHVKGDANTKWGNVMFRYGASYTRAWATFPISTEWTEVTIPWREFLQQNFDGPMDTHYKTVFWIEFTPGYLQTFGHPLSGLPAQSYQIDELRFVDGVNLAPTPQPQGNSIKKTVAKLKAKQPVKIVVMGASISWGLQTSNPAQDHWPLKLQGLLRTHFGYNNITVVNASIPGFNSFEGGCAIGAYIFNQEPIDLVMVADWCYNDYPDTDMQATGIAQIAKNYEAFFGLILRRANSEVMHIQSGLHCEAGQFTRMDSTNTALSALCDTMNIYKADVYGDFKARGQVWLSANYYTIAGDFAHFNAAGHMRAAEVVRDAIVTASTANANPVFNGPALAQPASVQIGNAITFSASATDPDSDPITYSWSFGNGASASGANVSHLYASVGSFTATVTASDGKGGNASSTVSVTVTAIPTPPVPPNQPPAITSIATAIPASANTGEPIQFSVAATDADGQPLTFTWYFNDGATATGTSAAHAFSTPGLYSVFVLVEDGKGGRVSSQVDVLISASNNGGGGGGASVETGVDSDSDGVSDFNELADGTNPNDATSLKKLPMTVTKLRGALNFKRERSDKCTFTAVLTGLPAQQSFTNATLRVDVAGVRASFTLSEKAKGSSENGQVRLKLKTTRDKATGKRLFNGGDIAISVALKNGSWAAQWLDNGSVNATVSSTTLTYPVEIAFNNRVYFASVSARYSAKEGASGKLKQ